MSAGAMRQIVKYAQKFRLANGGFLCFTRDSSSKSSTVDADEVAFLGSLQSEWWDRNKGMKPLHTMNKLRIPFIRDGLLETAGDPNSHVNSSTPLKNLKILEVGCGGGILTEPLSRLGAKVTGLDASEDLIALAKAHAVSSSCDDINYVCDTIEAFSQNNLEEFDGIIASEVVEHVTNKELFVESCIKTVRPGGSIFITTMNKTTLAWLGSIIIAENILKLLPIGTHQWEKFISPEDLSRIIEKYDCKRRKLHGMMYNALSNNWHWINDTSINYAMQFVKKTT